VKLIELLKLLLVLDCLQSVLCSSPQKLERRPLGPAEVEKWMHHLEVWTW
jgi:hypothetical protein